MADSIGQAYVQILPTTKGFSGQLSSQLGGDSVGLSSAGAGIGKSILKGAAAIGIGKAIVDGIKTSLNEGAALQQSLGGIETMFKDSADIVKANAAQAFSTVGISANEYMENVTSFSASLLQGLSGDTVKAAGLADIAMQAMGDNANKFGTEISSVMQTYQSLSRGNYQMLDNLRLGYGQTKAEMERLIEDASKMTDAQEKLGVTVDASSMSFDNIVSAIAVVQEEMGIAGTTAAEASETFTGSFSAMQAAAKDLLGNLAIGEDITPQLEALMQTGETFLMNNLVPMLENVFTGLTNNSDMLADVGVNIAMGLATSIVNGAPTILQSGVTLIMGLADGLAAGAPELITGIGTAVSDMVIYLSQPEVVTGLLGAGFDLIIALLEGLNGAQDELIGAMPEIIDNMVGSLIDLAPELIPAAIELMATLALGLISSVGTLLTSGDEIVERLKERFTDFDWSKIGKDILDGIKKGLDDAKDKLYGKIKEIADMLPDTVKKLLKINSPSKVMEDLYQWVPVGGAVGIEKNKHYLQEAIDDMVTDNALLGDARLNMSSEWHVDELDAPYLNAGEVYAAIRNGAADARPVVVLDRRLLTRELKEMGVVFA